MEKQKPFRVPFELPGPALWLTTLEIEQLHDDVIILQLPESFSVVVFSFEYSGFAF